MIISCLLQKEKRPPNLVIGFIEASKAGSILIDRHLGLKGGLGDATRREKMHGDDIGNRPGTSKKKFTMKVDLQLSRTPLPQQHLCLHRNDYWLPNFEVMCADRVC